MTTSLMTKVPPYVHGHTYTVIHTRAYIRVLGQVVYAKAEQRLALEGGHKDANELKPGGRYEGKAGDYAMHKFAYYLCFKCQVCPPPPPSPCLLSSHTTQPSSRCMSSMSLVACRNSSDVPTSVKSTFIKNFFSLSLSLFLSFSLSLFLHAYLACGRSDGSISCTRSCTRRHTAPLCVWMSWNASSHARASSRSAALLVQGVEQC